MIFIETIHYCLHANTSAVIFVALNSVFICKYWCKCNESVNSFCYLVSSILYNLPGHSEVQRNLAITTVFVTKDFAVKSNLLL